MYSPSFVEMVGGAALLGFDAILVRTLGVTAVVLPIKVIQVLLGDYRPVYPV